MSASVKVALDTVGPVLTVQAASFTPPADGLVTVTASEPIDIAVASFTDVLGLTYYLGVYQSDDHTLVIRIPGAGLIGGQIQFDIAVSDLAGNFTTYSTPIRVNLPVGIPMRTWTTAHWPMETQSAPFVDLNTWTTHG